MYKLRALILFLLVIWPLTAIITWSEKPEQPPLKYKQPDWETFRQQQRQTLQDIDPPQSPPADYEGNPVDWFLQNWYEENEVTPGELADDNIFLRRAHLDITGLLPSTDTLQGYLNDNTTDKRAAEVKRLLKNRQAYAEHWMTFWNDLLRNDEQTNIDGLREPVTQWLYNSLLSNKAYDRMVKELLNPAPEGPEGFLKGVNWRGAINASQRPVIQAAQNVSQVFLATTMKCASCHDHFTKDWKLADTYGLAACFSEDAELELYRCDTPTGETVTAQFPFEGLGQIDPNADLYTRREQAANMVVSPKNPRFAKTVVNRLWHKVMGHGLFEPVDDLDYSPTFEPLLDWLAYDLMAHDYNIKRTLELIMTTKAYQRKAQPHPETFVVTPDFDSPRIRRMSSEQILDGIFTVTGYSPTLPVMNVEVHNPIIRAWRHKYPGELATSLGRPTREQVTSVREQEANVLQMLELTNGDRFDTLLENSAEYILKAEPYLAGNPGRMIKTLFLRAYSRQPTEDEAAVLKEMLVMTEKENGKGKIIKQQALEDILWIIFMSPEYQYIH